MNKLIHNTAEVSYSIGEQKFTKQSNTVACYIRNNEVIPCLCNNQNIKPLCLCTKKIILFCLLVIMICNKNKK